MNDKRDPGTVLMRLAEARAHWPALAPNLALNGNRAGRAELVLAGGCFWCVEAVFAALKGVLDVQSGYAGGSRESARYEAVCRGDSGHAEAVRIVFEAGVISVDSLLQVFFLVAHDPTTLNRQGADHGSQYRSALFYRAAAEQAAFSALIERLNQSGIFPAPVVTTVEPLTAFYPAEAHHQNYVACHPYQPYVQGVALPKLAALQRAFPDLLKESE